jgi:hypothetical protein
MWSLYESFVRLLVKREKNDSFDPGSSFKVYFNQTDRMSAKTPLQTGTIILGKKELEIKGDTSFQIKFSDITSLRLEFPHSSAVLAHLIEVKYRPNGILYFGVLRFALFRLFVINNLLKTISLFEEIKKKVSPNLAWSVLDR